MPKDAPFSSALFKLSSFALIILQIILFFLSGLCSLAILKYFLKQNSAFFIALGIALFVPLFIFFFIIFIGFLYRFIPKVREGKYKSGTKEFYLFFASVMVDHMLHSMPFYNMILIFSPFAVLLYRIMGMKLDGSVLFSTGVKIYAPEFFTIKNFSVLSTNALLGAHLYEKGFLVVKKVFIGKNVIIGPDAKIAPGCVIGDNAVIGAGAILPKDSKVPSGEIWAGMPAKKIGKI